MYRKIYRPGERPATAGEYKEIFINNPRTLVESASEVVNPRIVTIDPFNTTPGCLDKCPPTQYPGRGWIKIIDSLFDYY